VRLSDRGARDDAEGVPGRAAADRAKFAASRPPDLKAILNMLYVLLELLRAIA